VTVWF